MTMAKKKTLPTRSKDVPATLGMLHLVRDELRSDARALDHNMDSGFARVDGELVKVRSEMNSMKMEMKSEIAGVKSEIAAIKSAVEKMSSSFHQMQLLAEEQRAENRIVMDGLTGLFSRQDRVEQRVDSLELINSQLKR